MERQERRFSCGPSALRAALYVLGHTVTEAALRRRAGTTKEGTDERGMMRAIAHYDHRGREYQVESGRKAWNWLRSTLGRGRPAILCTDNWDHWMAVVGRLGGRLLVFDPEKPNNGSTRRRQYSGLEIYTEIDLLARWAYVDEDTNKKYYYAISVI